MSSAGFLSGGFRGGLAIVRDRLISKGFSITFGFALALTVVAALVERNTGSYGAVDRTLGVVFSWIIPLVGLSAVATALCRRSLRDATWSVARFGASRRTVALAVSLALMAGCAGASVILASLALLLSHTASSPALAHDLFTTGWIAALTGASYAAWLSLGSTLGRRGGGRAAFILLDFILGRTDYFGAVFPRGNGSSLLGFGAPFDMSQPKSSVLMIGVSALVLMIATWRSRD